MMTGKPNISHIVELDGALYCLAGNRLELIDDLRKIKRDRWLVTDFQESLSRFMTVEGPVRYAELLVRRKLQESGEFEEPVHIITHWKKRRGKNTADIFFTAVPSRLARFYFEELREPQDITLVFPMYGVLWEILRRTRSKHPIAVVLRHNRFAEVLIGSRNRVYYANRCVAFDTQAEQLQALWDTIRSDIETVENENRLQVDTIVCLNWIAAHEKPAWPETWQKRIHGLEETVVDMDGQQHGVSWPAAIQAQSPRRSASPAAEKAFYLTRCWAPVVNLMLLAAVVLLILGYGYFQGQVHGVQTQHAAVQQQMAQIRFDQNIPPAATAFSDRLKFITELAHKRDMPSYQQIVNDLTQAAFNALRIQRLKVDYSSQQIRLELFGNIDASFDQAHGGYQRFLQNLARRGYRVEESRFETQINRSQVVLKLSRPIT